MRTWVRSVQNVATGFLNKYPEGAVELWQDCDQEFANEILLSSNTRKQNHRIYFEAWVEQDTGVVVDMDAYNCLNLSMHAFHESCVRLSEIFPHFCPRLEMTRRVYFGQPDHILSEENGMSCTSDEFEHLIIEVKMLLEQLNPQLAVFILKTKERAVLVPCIAACLQLGIAYCTCESPKIAQACLQNLTEIPQTVYILEVRTTPVNHSFRIKVISAYSAMESQARRGWVRGEVAYVKCTSGTTGQPKVHIISRRAYDLLMNNLVQGATFSATKFHADDVVACSTRCCFDAFDSTVGRFLLAPKGCRLIMTAECGDILGAQLWAQGVTYIHTTPSVWNTLSLDVRAGWKELRCLDLGGESVRYDHVRHLPGELPIIVSYGLTEATITSFLHLTSSNKLRECKLIPLGVPIPELVQFDISTRGTLILSGPCLALNLTHLGFLDTGDLINEQLVIGGRIFGSDVKVRGQRINLTELKSRVISELLIEESSILAIIPKETFITVVTMGPQSKNLRVNLEDLAGVPVAWYEWPENIQRPLNSSGKLDITN